MDTYQQLLLPPSVVTKPDVARLLDELERIDNLYTTARVRAKVGVTGPDQVRLSVPLNDFLTINQLDVNDSTVRSQLITQIRQLKDNLPIIHLTFAAEADQESLERLSTWAKQSIHHQAVLAIGLQPSLVGGVYVRTPNHVHDLSLRAQLAGKRQLLLDQLAALSAEGGR